MKRFRFPIPGRLHAPQRLGHTGPNKRRWAVPLRGHPSRWLLWLLTCAPLLAARAQVIYAPYTFTNFVGAPGGAGNADGTGSAARFRGPDGMAVDGAGNVYVSDSNNGTLRKITPTGTVTTLLAAGGTDGVAVDAAGNVFVAVNYSILKLTPAGAFSTLAGSPGVSGTADGTGSSARFSGPTGLAVDPAGNLYVADGYAIRRITPAGVVTTLAGSVLTSGSTDGANGAARFGSTAGTPRGVAVDAATNIYVADFGNSTIRKVSPVGTDWVVTTIAGSAGQYGYTDGAGSAARFSYIGPSGVAVDHGGNIYVTDSGNTTVRKLVFDGTSWNVTTLAGGVAQPGTADGTGSAARFSFLKGAAVNSAGTLFVADFQNQTIRQVTPAGVVTTFAGLAAQIGTADGTGSAALFYTPNRVAVDGAGNVYIADTSNHTIRRATPNGVVTTLAGKPGTGGSADGSNTVARFRHPNGLTVDSNTNIYVADTGNSLIRKVSPIGTNWAVTTIAGLAQTTGTNDGTGSLARFNAPKGIATDGAGNLYVADSANQTIRVIAPGGVVTTLAGLGGSPGFTDGTGSAARFDGVADIAADGPGNFVVSDGYRIRQVTAGGVVTTLAGCIGCTNALGNVDGTGSGIRPGYPIGLAADGAGNIYIADINDDTLRRLSPSGSDWTLTTLGGAVGQSSGVDGTGSGARFNGPTGVAVDSAGNLYVADTMEDRIAKGVAAILFDTTSGGLSASNGLLQVRVAAGAASNVVVEATANLQNWSPVLTNSLVQTGVNLSLPLGSGQFRFYRAHSLR